MAKNKRLWILILLATVGFFAITMVSSYNTLIGMEGDVDESWAQVENVYQRRNDLIPNLVNSVEGSMQQEQEVFGRIADARQSANKASGVEEVEEANAELNQEVQTLINVIHENYPELASSDNVKDLMTQLEGTENRISVERMRYNKEVTNYNKTIRRIPMNIIAGVTGFEQKDLFEMDEGADEVPEVEFGVGD